MIFLNMKQLEEFRTENNLSKAQMNKLMKASHNYYNDIIRKGGICSEKHGARLLKELEKKCYHATIDFVEYIPNNYKEIFEKELALNE